MAGIAGEFDWAGVAFKPLAARDLHMLSAPGLYGLVRRLPTGERVLLYVGHAEVLAEAATAEPRAWAEAARLGLNEVHVHLRAHLRIDRLQLAAHLVKRVQPLLNVVDEAAPAPLPQWRRAG